MKILFRTDASEDIGTGHVMRCSTLAQALLEQGANIYFACRHLPNHLKSMLLEKGFNVYLLNETQGNTKKDTHLLPHSEWLGASQTEDANATLKSIGSEIFDWIIVDHYALDKFWEEMMRSVTDKIMVIDDLADREHSCDVLLDQNFYIDQNKRYQHLVPETCRMLLGPQYALLRSEFKEYRAKSDIRSGDVKRILVFFGGVDQFDFTSKVVLALSNIPDKNFIVDVVIGAQHPSGKKLILLCKKFGFNLHIQTDKMAELMLEADLAIGAGGGTVWERSCLKLPSICIPIAEHQVTQLNDLSRTGIIYSFETSDLTSPKIQKHVESLIENHALRYLLSSNSASLVDGAGITKLVRAIISPALLNIRLATIADERDLHEWRNHPKIREVSFNQEAISLEQHAKWFRDSLSNKHRILLIGQLGEKPVGVVRFDLDENSAEISIFLIQHKDTKGFGQSLLCSAENWLKENKSNVSVIKANIVEKNIISQRFFEHAGYSLIYRGYEKVL